MKTVAAILIAAHVGAYQPDVSLLFHDNGRPILSVMPDGTLEFDPGIPHEVTAKKAMETLCELGRKAGVAPYEMTVESAVYVGDDGELVFGPGFKGSDEDRADWAIIAKAYAQRCSI